MLKPWANKKQYRKGSGRPLSLVLSNPSALPWAGLQNRQRSERRNCDLTVLLSRTCLYSGALYNDCITAAIPGTNDWLRGSLERRAPKFNHDPPCRLQKML